MAENCRNGSRRTVDTPGTVYHKDGHFLLACVVKELSRNGGRVELLKECALPTYFLLSMMPDGSAPRLCSKVWQLDRVAGIRFVENSAAT